MKKLILTFLASTILNSCTVYGIGNDYEDLPDYYQQRIKTLENFNHLNPYLIYKISGKQLSAELKNHPKAIVYIFTNGKDGRIKPLKDYIDFANQNNYKLFFVMNGYHYLRSTLEDLSTFPSPVFSIDNKAYGTDSRASYINQFENDLKVKEEQKDKILINTLFYFENGNFVKIIDEYSGSKPRKRITINGR